MVIPRKDSWLSPFSILGWRFDNIFRLRRTNSFKFNSLMRRQTNCRTENCRLLKIHRVNSFVKSYRFSFDHLQQTLLVVFIKDDTNTTTMSAACPPCSVNVRVDILFQIKIIVSGGKYSAEPAREFYSVCFCEQFVLVWDRSKMYFFSHSFRSEFIPVWR